MILSALDHYTENFNYPPGFDVHSEYHGDFADWLGDIGIGTRSGVPVTTETARRVSAFFGASRIVSSTIAGMPLDLIRSEGKRRDPATDLGLYNVLKTDPTTYSDSYTWRSCGLMDLILTGHWINIIDKPAGSAEPEGFIPVPTAAVEIELTKTGRKRYRINHGVQGQAEAFVGQTLSDDKVLDIVSFSDDYGVTGRSILQFARESLGLAIASESTAGSFFAQGLLNKGFFCIPDSMEQDEEDEFQESMKRQSGPGQVPVLPFGMTYKSASMSATDAQLLESRAMGVKDIARFFTMPPDVLGDTSAQPRANMEQNGIRLMTFALLPWAVGIEQAIGRQLLRRFSIYRSQQKGQVSLQVKHKFQGIMRADIIARSRALIQYLQWGVMTRDELREIEDLNPLPDRAAGSAILQPKAHGIAGEDSPSDNPGAVLL